MHVCTNLIRYTCMFYPYRSETHLPALSIRGQKRRLPSPTSLTDCKRSLVEEEKQTEYLMVTITKLIINYYCPCFD